MNVVFDPETDTLAAYVADRTVAERLVNWFVANLSLYSSSGCRAEKRTKFATPSAFSSQRRAS